MPVVSSAIKSGAIRREEELHKALLKATKRSTHKRHQTGCIIVTTKGEIISSGCSHASSFRMSELHSIHAEIHALGKARHHDLNGAIAYISTIARKSGNFVFSAPCLTCAIALRAAGVSLAVYHNGDNRPMKHPWNELMLDDLIESKGLKVYPRRRK